MVSTTSFLNFNTENMTVSGWSSTESPTIFGWMIHPSNWLTARKMPETISTCWKSPHVNQASSTAGIKAVMMPR